MKENKVQQISHKPINIVVFVATVEYAYLSLHFY
ncbi:small membrane protein YkgR [Escherichia coli]|nr:small membrane protein YkgR [Escherichia coli]